MMSDQHHHHHTNHTAPPADSPPEAHQHHHHGHAPQAAATSRPAVATVEEELGAAAVHGHEAMVHTGHAVPATQGAHAGHGGGHAGHTEEMFRLPFAVALLLTIPVVLSAELFQELFGYHLPAFPGSQWLAPVLASVIYWYGGWVFLSGAAEELRARRPGMMTLVALAITSAYVYSLAVTVGLVAGMAFYWELATLVTIMLLGHWLELRAVGSARSALNELAKLLPDQAERVAGERTELVPVAALRVGDLVLVRPGGRVPADGAVEEGHSQVNESMITGESRPVEKGPRGTVIAGTVNGSGALRVRVTTVGEGTMLAGIMRLVAEAQTSRTRAQALADQAAYWLTLVAVGVALATLVGWTLARGFDDYTLERVVTTLVVACPHALGLAIPLVIAISTTLSARNGILVRDRLALERARTVDAVVFDKTGTLTTGEQGLVALATAEGTSEEQALALAATAERDSEHIIARAVVQAAAARGVTVPRADAFRALPGRGVEATVAGRTVRIGGPRLLEQAGVALTGAIAEQARAWGTRGQTVVYLIEQRRVLAAFALADTIRPESYDAIASLKEQGIRVVMLTGDAREVAAWVAGELGIDEHVAEVLPEHKNEHIRALQARGLRVAMVGDGVNDAPALAQADVGIAIGAGTDVARASAGIVLVRDAPRDVAGIIRLSRATYRKMVQNLAWAVGYNAIALPLAAGALAGVGFVLPAWAGAGLMSLSTIIVAVNAQTLRGLRLREGDDEAPQQYINRQPAQG